MTPTWRKHRCLFGHPRFAGSVLHAVPDTYYSPEDNTTDLFGKPAYTGDPSRYLRSHTSPLCGTGRNELTVVLDEEFSPAGLRGQSDSPRRLCPECLAKWAEHWTTDLPITKQCTSCGRDLPVNKFRGDKRTKDGMSNTCEACRRTATQQRGTLKVELQRLEANANAIERERINAHRRAEALDYWQQLPWTATFTCQSGHALEATVKEEVAPRPLHASGYRSGAVNVNIPPSTVDASTFRAVWECPCGTAEVDPLIVDLALRAHDDYRKRGNVGPASVSLTVDGNGGEWSRTS